MIGYYDLHLCFSEVDVARTMYGFAYSGPHTTESHPSESRTKVDVICDALIQTMEQMDGNKYG